MRNRDSKNQVKPVGTDKPIAFRTLRYTVLLFQKLERLTFLKIEPCKALVLRIVIYLYIDMDIVIYIKI